MFFFLPAARRPRNVAWLLGAALLATSCATTPDPTTVAPTNPLPEHLTLGNPSGATPNSQQPTNYLLLKPEYALSYHRDQGKPNWVSWHLTAADQGPANRQDDFRADATLPAGWYRVSSSSYSGSGFDRGHNCPSADRTATQAQNSATFLMTNMVPEAPNHNRQTWVGLENYCRAQLDGGRNELYILMGSYGRGGTGANGFATTLDQGRLTVPARIWKVVVVLPTAAGNDAARVSSSTRVIAIDTPNDNALNSNWGQYRVSIDAIEAATGLDLLSAVPVAVQRVIEARVDDGPV
ncbi:DNA/RNA endonuclease [Hymenobacter amundsenii]|uniref:DNA/RNA endonuclease n=1 Tax=Hymenobacter amundsenii TaxID=2006685 RepID=A0A246FMV3_9BACT|nr:DNA/RNA non-specific endonuclease [Hymenobacter amundsenii]OWP64009.1 DNA/RNA endonuclease [Hymenobacter amundsenii]